MDMEFKTTLGEHFPVRLAYGVNEDGEVETVKVFDLQGQDLTDLIFDSSRWDEAWNKALGHASACPAISAAARAAARDCGQALVLLVWGV